VVAGVEQGADHVGVDRQCARPDPVEHRLDPVRELGDGGQADHRRRPLDAVRGAEGPVEVGAVPLAALQLHQPLFQAEQELARLLEEHLQEPIVRNTQGPTPSSHQHFAGIHRVSIINAAILP